MALIGLLNAQYTLTGYDASAHMSEETHDAEMAAPRGIVWSVVISVIFGFILLVAMNVGITPDKVFTGTDGSMVDGYTHALQSPTGVPPVQIWIDAVGQSLGHASSCSLVIGAQFFCGMSSVTANSRMIYAFSRDGAVPGQLVLAPDQQADPHPDELDLAGGRRGVHPRAAVPVQPGRVLRDHLDRGHRAVRRVHQRRSSCAGAPATSSSEGPWKLGRWSRPIGIVATIWVVFIFFLFMLPQALPINDQHLQLHAGGVPGGPRRRGLWYFVSAKNWFKGPKVQGTPEELREIERDLEVI